MSVLKSLVPSGRVAPPQVKTPHYENVPPDALLPPRGEDVWVDHPIFTADKILPGLLVGEGLEYVIETHRCKDEERLKEMRDWMCGRIPIPDAALEMLLLTREVIGMYKGESLPPVRQGGVAVDEELRDALKYVHELTFVRPASEEKEDIDLERLAAADATVKRALYGDESAGDEPTGVIETAAS